MIKVFVSGCYDILHAGHIQFFMDARALGDHLTVCFASDDVLKLYKGRESAIPEDNKSVIIGSLKYVDQVVKSSDIDPIFDFVQHIESLKPDILAVTQDDKHKSAKRALCKKYNMKLVVLPKRTIATPISTTKIRQRMNHKEEVPLRVDFAGGWLDVPKFAIEGSYIVNLTITPKVSLENWPYELASGLGGSAAKAILELRNGSVSELSLGVGWQDPAVIEETGLCVWRSGKKPILDSKFNPNWLSGKMLLSFTGTNHNTPHLVSKTRDFGLIAKASLLAKDAVERQSLKKLAQAVKMSYRAQLKEGMAKLPEMKNSLARKYLGGGHGGYALYLFDNTKDRNSCAKPKNTKIVEPFLSNRAL